MARRISDPAMNRRISEMRRGLIPSAFDPSMNGRRTKPESIAAHPQREEMLRLLNQPHPLPSLCETTARVSSLCMLAEELVQAAYLPGSRYTPSVVALHAARELRRVTDALALAEANLRAAAELAAGRGEPTEQPDPGQG